MKPRPRSVVVLASLAMALPAAADLIYSNFQNISIPADYDGVYLNVETGAWNTNMNSPVSGWDINPYFGGSTLANSPDFQPVRSGTGNLDSVLNLAEGVTVGSGSTFSTFVQGAGGENPGGAGYGGSETHLGNGVGQFTDGVEGYLGFRINGTDYGSMRVVLTNNTGGAVIKDWAYDNSGAPAVVGAIKQVGQDVIMSSGFTLASALVDSGGATNLVKTGSGTNILKATSTYTGTTTITEGTLALAAGASLTDTSTVTVQSGGTLAGTGTIGGSTTIEIGGIHSPGLTTGVQTFSSGLTYDTGSTLQWTLNDNTLGLRGTDFDGIDVSGGVLSIASGVTSELVFNGAGSTVDWADTFWDLSRSWLVFDNAASPSLTSGIFGTITASDDSLSQSFATTGGTFAWNQSGNDLYLTYTVVPEPRAALLCGLASLLLLRRRRP